MSHQQTEYKINSDKKKFCFVSVLESEELYVLLINIQIKNIANLTFFRQFIVNYNFKMFPTLVNVAANVILSIIVTDKRLTGNKKELSFVLGHAQTYFVLQEKKREEICTFEFKLIYYYLQGYYHLKRLQTRRQNIMKTPGWVYHMTSYTDLLKDIVTIVTKQILIGT